MVFRQPIQEYGMPFYFLMSFPGSLCFKVFFMCILHKLGLVYLKEF